MVIVFFGTPQFAVPTLEHLLASRHLVAAVITQPDRPRGRGQKVTDSPVKATAASHNVPIYQPERLRDPRLSDLLHALQPDLGVVAAYGKIIPDELLRVPRHGMINVHASLLPKYRGAAPVHRAVINGESETGVTIMQVVKALDAGDMLAQSARAIAADETSDVVERALAADGARLLLDVIEQIDSGTVTPEPQDEASATYAPRLTKEEGLIDWSLSARQIHNRVRGLYPWPHAYSYIERARLIVLKTWIPEEVRLPSSREAPPRTRTVDGLETEITAGTIVDVTGDAIEVATGHGERLLVTEVQPEGRRPMRVREFLTGSGRAIRAGLRFDIDSGDRGSGP